MSNTRNHPTKCTKQETITGMLIIPRQDSCSKCNPVFQPDCPAYGKPFWASFLSCCLSHQSGWDPCLLLITPAKKFPFPSSVWFVSLNNDPVSPSILYCPACQSCLGPHLCACLSSTLLSVTPFCITCIALITYISFLSISYSMLTFPRGIADFQDSSMINKGKYIFPLPFVPACPALVALSSLGCPAYFVKTAHAGRFHLSVFLPACLIIVSCLCFCFFNYSQSNFHLPLLSVLCFFRYFVLYFGPAAVPPFLLGQTNFLCPQMNFCKASYFFALLAGTFKKR